MRQILTVLILFVLSCSVVIAETLSAGVSVNDIPKSFFGSWRVIAKLDDTNSYKTFKPNSVDIWNLSRIGDDLTLDNPFTGAKANVSIRTVEGNLIVFSRKVPFDNKILLDTVSLRLEDGKFSGINTLSLEYYSLIDNHLMKTETARYVIKGEKIAGENILSK